MRPSRMALTIAFSLLTLLVFLGVTAILVSRSNWFREMVRERIVAEVEAATGGRVTIASFRFDWRLLRAEIHNFVIHGREPAGEAPLFRARSVEVGLKIVSVFKRAVDVAFLKVEEPQVIVIVFPDGRTNLPEPKRRSDKDPIQTVLDLAIKRFEINNGTIDFASKKTPLNARGENLRALFVYELLGSRYKGDISIRPVHLQTGQDRPVPLDLNLVVGIEQNRIEISGARLSTGQSRIELAGKIEDLRSPRASLQASGRLIPAELARLFDTSSAADWGKASAIDLNVSLSSQTGRVRVPSAVLHMGRSRVDVSGDVDMASGHSSLSFDARLAAGDWGRILKLASSPEGTLHLSGSGRFASSKDYNFVAKLNAREFVLRQGKMRLSGINAASLIEVDPNVIEFDQLRISALGGSFSGRAAIAKLTSFRVDGQLRDFSVRDLIRTYYPQDLVWDGIVAGPINVQGALKSPVARRLRAVAKLRILPGNRGVPLTGSIAANYDGPHDSLDLGKSYLATPSTRLDLSGAIGKQIQVRLASRDLRDFQPVLALASSSPPRALPVSLKNGAAIFDGTVRGSLDAPQVGGRVSVTNFILEGRGPFDQLTAGIALDSSHAAVQDAVLTKGKSQARLEGSVGLRQWKTEATSVVSARASVKDAELAELLAMADRTGTPLRGTFTAAAQVSGTLDQPNATANLAVVRGVAYDEPFDRVEAKLNYAGQRLELTAASVTAGAARVDLKGAFVHQPKDFQSGRLQFQVAGNKIPLEQLRTIQKRQPGLKGALQVAANGIGALQNIPGKPRFLLSSLNAEVGATSLELNQKRLGNLLMTAASKESLLDFRLRSDFADAKIEGDGQLRLDGDYPLTARASFSAVTLSSIQAWTAAPAAGSRSKVDGVVEGKLTVSGPVLQQERLQGSLELTKLEIGPSADAANGPILKRATLRNAEPILVTLDRSVVRLRDARLIGEGTDVRASGTVSLDKANALDLRVNAGMNLKVLGDLNPDVFAAGDAALNAVVRGPLRKPMVNGRLQLKDAAVNMVGLPNGVSKANGVIMLDQSRATIDQLSAETGGGKITLAGFVTYGSDDTPFQLEAKANEVRVRYPEGASTVADAVLTLSGTSRRSLLSGTVTILRASFSPESDLSSMLAKSAEPVRTPRAQTGLLEGMQFAVQIQSAPDVRFESALAQDLQAEANLRLRGSPSRPGLLGRVLINRGEATFFGTKYTIQQGTVSFFNPDAIEPILNVDLESKARGIEVILTLSGPINKLKITHRSDPPLPFSEIVALLATGRPPTTDPTLLARQQQPEQTWQQAGGSALLGHAVANPVAGRLQRLFGVSKFKIDPQIVGVENNPQARLTLEQQVTKDLTFTYITDVTQSNTQIIRIHWDISKILAAAAVREENGQFGLDFMYRKRFR